MKGKFQPLNRAFLWNAQSEARKKGKVSQLSEKNKKRKSRAPRERSVQKTGVSWDVGLSLCSGTRRVDSLYQVC